MKDLTSILAMLSLVALPSLVMAQDVATETAEDDCEEQSETDDDACAPAAVLGGGTGAVALGGLGAGGTAAIGFGAAALAAIAAGGSGSHSGSH